MVALHFLLLSRASKDARLDVIEEIVSTERDYVDDLSNLITGFLQPLRV
jgi:hypothetical protein